MFSFGARGQRPQTPSSGTSKFKIRFLSLTSVKTYSVIFEGAYMDSEIINERVEVAAVFYKTQTEQQRCMPIKMHWRGRDITFTELGLRHPTNKGQRTIHVFDMTDGAADYRLEFDSERLLWTLAAVLVV